MLALRGCMSRFRAASLGVQASWKEPLFPPGQNLSLWRELERRVWIRVWIRSEVWHFVCLSAP